MPTDRENFLGEMRSVLRRMSNAQIVNYAWICGVSSFPAFCGLSNQSDKMLYSVMSALDSCAYIASINQGKRVVFSNIDIIEARRTANITAANHTASDAVAAAAAAAAAAYNAALYADAADLSYTAYTPDVADAAADAASYTIDVLAYITGQDHNYFHQMMLNEIKNSMTWPMLRFIHGSTFYGDIWKSFQKNLREIGCGYWADLYTRIIGKGCVFDQEEIDALKMRSRVPKEKAKQGAAAVAAYLLNTEKQGTVYINRETRLIILGSAGAGKTTLAKRIKGDMSYPKAKDSTHGVDTSIVLDFNGVKTHIWDFGGQVIYHASHRCFMSANCVYILVVNARTEENRDIERIEYWLDTIRVYSNDMAKVFIVINESDNREQNCENYNSLMEGEYRHLVQGIFNFNIGEDMEEVKYFREVLAAYIGDIGYQSFGKNDSAAMLELRRLFDNKKKILENEDFKNILNNNHIIGDREKQRIKALFNELGVALSYDFMEGYVLDPYWISHGVYKVIEYMMKTSTKFLPYSRIGEVFADEISIYPLSKSKYILDLMAHYKIGFRNEGGIRGLIVPCVASQLRPKDVAIDEELDRSLVTWVERDDLQEFPADFFYRYICANKDDIRKNDDMWSMWQNGMVLTRKRSSALVELNKNIRIEISVWGDEKREYMDDLILQIDDLLKEYRFTSHKTKRETLSGKWIQLITIGFESIGKGFASKALESIFGKAINGR